MSISVEKEDKSHGTGRSKAHGLRHRPEAQLSSHFGAVHPAVHPMDVD